MNLIRSALGPFNRRMQKQLLNSRYIPDALSRAAGFAIGRTLYWYYRLAPNVCREPRHYLATRLGQGDVYLDIGASEGHTALIANVAVARSGRVFAFEPQMEVFDSLKTAKSRFGWVNVQVVNTLVGDRVGEVELFEHGGNSQISSINPHWNRDSGRAVQHPMTTLDDWVATENVRVDFAKIDVEGAELMVLKGAAHLLNRDHPVLLVEINNRRIRREHFGYDIGDVFDLLRSYGYSKFRALRSAGPEAVESEDDLLPSDFDLLVEV